VYKFVYIRNYMKRDIHPELHEITARCTCGYEFQTRSTLPELRVTICGNCHPFFTGDQKFVDTAGRIEKFQKRYDAQAAASAKKSKKK
jgi:large subunit ribosomal protein L31